MHTQGLDARYHKNANLQSFNKIVTKVQPQDLKATLQINVSAGKNTKPTKTK